MNWLRSGLRSPITSWTGILGAIVAVLQAVQFQFDADPNTVANWQEAIAIALLAFGLVGARDAGKSSEDSGVK